MKLLLSSKVVDRYQAPATLTPRGIKSFVFYLNRSQVFSLGKQKRSLRKQPSLLIIRHQGRFAGESEYMKGRYRVLGSVLYSQFPFPFKRLPPSLVLYRYNSFPALSQPIKGQS